MRYIIKRKIRVKTLKKRKDTGGAIPEFASGSFYVVHGEEFVPLYLIIRQIERRDFDTSNTYLAISLPSEKYPPTTNPSRYVIRGTQVDDMPEQAFRTRIKFNKIKKTKGKYVLTDTSKKYVVTLTTEWAEENARLFNSIIEIVERFASGEDDVESPTRSRSRSRSKSSTRTRGAAEDPSDRTHKKRYRY